MNYLRNIGQPNSFRIKYDNLQLADYILFDPRTLSKLLGSDELHPTKAIIDKYIKLNQNYMEKVHLPTGYMVAEKISLNESKYSKMEVSRTLSRYKYEECTDLNLLLCVFGKTVNNLYIPNREPTFAEKKFEYILLFPKQEVES